MIAVVLPSEPSPKRPLRRRWRANVLQPYEKSKEEPKEELAVSEDAGKELGSCGVVAASETQHEGPEESRLLEEDEMLLPEKDELLEEDELLLPEEDELLEEDEWLQEDEDEWLQEDEWLDEDLLKELGSRGVVAACPSAHQSPSKQQSPTSDPDDEVSAEEILMDKDYLDSKVYQAYLDKEEFELEY